VAEVHSADQPQDAEAFNLACYELTRALQSLEFSVPEAAPLARHLLRVVGRIVIDTATPGADPATWANTEQMALLWMAEALRAHGYEVKPIPGGGREELAGPGPEWT
jgi:hypothetical protein